MSDVGKFLRAKCKELGYPLINIVRKQEQVEELKADGHKYVLNSEDSLFMRHLREMAAELGATIAFECVAGETTGKVFNSLPPRSEVYVYGSLSLKMISEIHPSDLIFKQKSIKGFHLIHNFLQNKNVSEFEERLKSDVEKGYINPKIQKEVSLENLEVELEHYAGNLGKGKLLLNLMA